MSGDERDWDYAYDDEADRPAGRPLLATIIGAVLVLLLVGGMSERTVMEMISNRQGVLTFFLTGAVMALIVWGIAFVITIRKAGLGWKLGSLVVLLLLSLVVAFGKIGTIGQAAMADSREAARQMQKVLDGGEMPERVEGGTGPLTQMVAAMANGMLGDRRAFDLESREAGLDMVLTFEGLTHSSPVLRDCGALDALAGRARFFGRNRAVHVAAARAIGDQAVRDGRLPASAVDDFEQGARNSGRTYEHQWGLTADSVVEAAAVCRILASRPWSKPADTVLFTYERDTEEANRRFALVNRNMAELRRLQAEARGNAQQRINEMSGRPAAPVAPSAPSAPVAAPACPDRPSQDGVPPPAHCAPRGR